MPLSQKQKCFSPVLAAPWKYSLNVEHFEKKDDRHRFCISEIKDSQNVAR